MSKVQPRGEVRAQAPQSVRSSSTRGAWICLLCTGLTLPAGVVASSLIIDGLGYDPNNSEALPASVALLAGSVALVIILIAPVSAFILGRRAVRAGDGRGQVPMLLGGIGAVLFFAANMGQFVLGLLLD